MNARPLRGDSCGMTSVAMALAHAVRNTMQHASKLALAALLLALVAAQRPARAEPYLAVQQGLECGACHFNPTGGGMRNAVGNAFAQGALPAHHVDTGNFVWTGALNPFMATGGDLRANVAWTDPSTADNSFNLQQVRLYLGVTMVPDRLSFYIDEQVAPDAAVNREAWAMYRFDAGRWYLRAGRMYLSYGLRVQDQAALVRRVTDINMATPDNGMEIGYLSGPWNAQFAVSNGTDGATENNNGKQYTGSVVYVQSSWRLGASGTHNDDSAKRTTAGGIFGGLRTGPVAWLAEADLIDMQPGSAPTEHLSAALLELDWHAIPGGNLKLTGEWLDPDRDHGGPTNTRYSVVAEYTPIQYLQLRLGARRFDNRSQDQTVSQAFLEVHAYF